ncbi:MAG: hypothetical protein KJ893_10425 [Candidatus Omnitrophica bacterium]|nr:hypothetical protein [Candidatus Omnitrophota bacterium]MBU4478921.1 hypothetical protein [Candidatus Omnitrophota bacterium]MCG2704380.1 hypothetical protein [Candidatus Omnitrophota bacterium]
MKRILKITSIILIQIFLVSNTVFCGGFMSLEKPDKKHICTLSPRLHINRSAFKNILQEILPEQIQANTFFNNLTLADVKPIKKLIDEGEYDEIFKSYMGIIETNTGHMNVKFYVLTCQPENCPEVFLYSSRGRHYMSQGAYELFLRVFGRENLGKALTVVHVYENYVLMEGTAGSKKGFTWIVRSMVMQDSFEPAGKLLQYIQTHRTPPESAQPHKDIPQSQKSADAIIARIKDILRENPKAVLDNNDRETLMRVFLDQNIDFSTRKMITMFVSILLPNNADLLGMVIKKINTELKAIEKSYSQNRIEALVELTTSLVSSFKRGKSQLLFKPEHMDSMIDSLSILKNVYGNDAAKNLANSLSLLLTGNINFIPTQEQAEKLHDLIEEFNSRREVTGYLKKTLIKMLEVNKHIVLSSEQVNRWIEIMNKEVLFNDQEIFILGLAMRNSPDPDTEAIVKKISHADKKSKNAGSFKIAVSVWELSRLGMDMEKISAFINKMRGYYGGNISGLKAAVVMIKTGIKKKGSLEGLCQEAESFLVDELKSKYSSGDLSHAAKTIEVMLKAGIAEDDMKEFVLHKIPDAYAKDAVIAIEAAGALMREGIELEAVERLLLENFFKRDRGSIAAPAQKAGQILVVDRSKALDYLVEQGIERETARDFLFLELPELHGADAGNIAIGMKEIIKEGLTGSLEALGVSRPLAWKYMLFDLARIRGVSNYALAGSVAELARNKSFISRLLEIGIEKESINELIMNLPGLFGLEISKQADGIILLAEERKNIIGIIAGKLGDYDAIRDFFILELPRVEGADMKQAGLSLLKIIEEGLLEEILEDVNDKDEVRKFLLRTFSAWPHIHAYNFFVYVKSMLDPEYFQAFNRFGIDRRVFINMLLNDSIKVYDPEKINPLITRGAHINQPFSFALKFFSAKGISRIFSLHPKLAEHLRGLEISENDFKKLLLDEERKQLLNEISSHLNREYTLHPAERRLQEDEKASLFDYLLSLDNVALQTARDKFVEFFANKSNDYNLDIDALNEIMQHVSVEELGFIIRFIKEDPKLSITEIEQKVRKRFAGNPGVEFIVRKVKWLISNMFILEPKAAILLKIIKQLEPSDDDAGMEKLRMFIKSINRAKTFRNLNSIAGSNKIDLADIMQIKFDSSESRAKENILISLLSDNKALPRLPEPLFEDVMSFYLRLSPASKKRIYAKVLLRAADNYEGLKDLIKNDFFELEERLVDFFRLYRHDAGDMLEDMKGYLWIVANQDESMRKGLMKLLDDVYDRESIIAYPPDIPDAPEILRRIQEQISVRGKDPLQSQIPHIFLEPLLKLAEEKDETIFTLFRDMIMAMNENEQFTKTNSLAAVKNQLYEELKLFANQPAEEKKIIFRNLLAFLSKGQISEHTVYELVFELQKYMGIYRKALEVYQKGAQFRGKESNKILLGLAEEIIESAKNSIFDHGKINEFLAEYGRMKSELLVSQFERYVNVNDGEKAKIFAFAATKESEWRDYAGRDLFELIIMYLSYITDSREHYELIFESLIHWIDGDFDAWRYTSSDYQQLINMVIEAETSKMDSGLKKVFESAPGEDAQEKLNNISGEEFNELKDKIKKINTWEKDLRYQVIVDGKEYVLAITGDFIELFNIGNYKGSTSCQSCAYANNLNIGLLDYVVNGSNKGAILYDEEGNIIARRIVRIKPKIFSDGLIEPIIFVEESAQFGMQHDQVDLLYAALKISSSQTQMKVDSSMNRETESSALCSEGIVKNIRIILLKGRSSWYYSDAYNYARPYEQTTAQEIRDVRVREKDIPDKKVKDIEKEFGLTEIINERITESDKPAETESAHRSSSDRRQMLGLQKTVQMQRLVEQAI